MKVQELFESEISGITVEDFGKKLMAQFPELKVQIHKRGKGEQSDLGTYHQLALKHEDISAREIAQIGDFIKKFGLKSFSADNGHQTEFFPAKGTTTRIHKVVVAPEKGDALIWVLGYDKASKNEYVNEPEMAEA